MPKIIFEDRAVAFVDVSGFGSLVNEASLDQKKLSELQGIVDLLESSIPLLNIGVDKNIPEHLIPKHLYISDCIILSAPLSDTKIKSYNGLEVIAMRVSQLTHIFLRAGYLVGGGLAVGKVWHGDANIIGPAYQEAFIIEDGNHKPCIILSERAKEHWAKGECANSRMCLSYNDDFIVNGLNDFYIIEKHIHGGIDDAFKRYECIVDTNLTKDLPRGATEKWAWFKEYLVNEKSFI